MLKKAKKKVLKKFDADKWLKKHLEELVDKYAGEYILVAVILGMRVPQPQDFLLSAGR